LSRTNLTVITEALRLAGVIHEIETPTNEDAQDALRRLNDMMLGFERHKGVKLGYYPQTSLSADIPVDDEYFEVITLQLAKRIGQHWGTSLSPDVMAQASESWRSLMAEFIGSGEADLNHAPGHRGSSYDISSDT
jgi:hypothetical protein